MSESGLTRQVAAWVDATQFDDLPRRVVEEAKNQLVNGIAAMHAGHFSEVGRGVRRTVRDWSPGKDATTIPAGDRAPLATALFVNACGGAALEYDDVLFSGATGNAAVATALAFAEKANLTGKQLVLCQVLANEVAGRTGIALAPLALPLPSFPAMSSVGAAVVAAKALGLDAAGITRALGLALAASTAHPAVRASYFGADGRAIGIANATQFGAQAAQLAANGVGGTGEFLGGPGGLFAAASIDVAAIFATLGRTWLTETLSYKIYPVHVGLCTVIDCALDIVRQHPVDVKKVQAIHVAAAPAALEADAIARPYLEGVETPIAALAYSIAYNIAAALTDRELTARQLSRDRVADPALWGLVDRVHVGRDEAFAERSRTAWLARTLGPEGRAVADLDPLHVSQFRMSVGARVRVELEDGRSFHAEEEVAAGCAGRAYDDRRKAVEDKFRRETRYSLRKERMEKAIDLALHVERANAANVRELIRLCCSEND